MAPLAGTSLRRKQSTCRVWRPALVVLPALLGAAVASPATIQSGGPGGVSMLFAARVATPIRLVVDPMVERVRSEVTIRIDARTRLASFEVLEEFRNNAGRVLEGDYLYAIPRGAVFHNLSLFAGENEMRGEMLQAEQARAIYEEIVRKRRDPALVELAGRDLIRARVFPIEPGDTRRIILRYAQVLPLLGDALRMQFPRTASVMDLRGDGPQGFPEPRADIRRATPTAPALASAVHVRIEHASMLGTPYSPTDAIDVVRRDGSLVEVRLLENERRPGRAAFELLLPRLGSTIGASLLAHAPDPGSEDGYFLLLLNPPAADTTETIARDVSLVLDVSGSMAGHKIEQARSALEQLLRGLRLHDRFRLDHLLQCGALVRADLRVGQSREYRGRHRVPAPRTGGWQHQHRWCAARGAGATSGRGPVVDGAVSHRRPADSGRDRPGADQRRGGAATRRRESVCVRCGRRCEHLPA